MRLSRCLTLFSLPLGLLLPGRAARGQGTVVPLPPTRIGLTAGMNLAKTGTDGVSNRQGFMGGISLVTPFTPNMAYQLEALFTMKGGDSHPTPTTKSTLAIDYLEIPVMLRADIPLSSTIRPFAFSGPAASFKMACSIDASSSPRGTPHTSCDDAEKNDPSGGTFNTVDVGWIFGGGLAFDARGRALTIGARYEYGLRKISTVGDSKNRVLSFAATVEVPLPRR